LHILIATDWITTIYNLFHHTVSLALALSYRIATAQTKVQSKTWQENCWAVIMQLCALTKFTLSKVLGLS